MDCKRGIRFEAEIRLLFNKKRHFCLHFNQKRISLMVVFYPGFHRPSNCIFVYLGFLSRPFTNHRTEWKGKGISLTPDQHFHPRHRHLDISRAISAESSPLHIASSRTRNGNIWFLSTSCQPIFKTSVCSITIAQLDRTKKTQCATQLWH